MKKRIKRIDEKLVPGGVVLPFSAKSVITYQGLRVAF